MKNKEKGIILIEILIVFGILVSIFSITFITFKHIEEKKDLEKAVIKISEVIDEYTLKSLSTGMIYKIDIDYLDKNIKIKTITDKIEETINLPTKLSYLVPYTINGSSQLIDKLSITTTMDGNLSDSFTTYILDYSGKIKYRIATYTFQENKILKINIYKKISGVSISKKELLKYHELLFSVEELNNEWRKQ
ncbi:type II secretion system protein [Fusobacterium sp.]|uniref:type II secretion system protein n=1 Tax=Fusobacterium sp. TaxID=68766 RepID=UPI00263353E2|nr:type II secretion system protein [Fusobacterium sp.]